MRSIFWKFWDWFSAPRPKVKEVIVIDFEQFARMVAMKPETDEQHAARRRLEKLYISLRTNPNFKVTRCEPNGAFQVFLAES